MTLLHMSVTHASELSGEPEVLQSRLSIQAAVKVPAWEVSCHIVWDTSAIKPRPAAISLWCRGLRPSHATMCNQHMLKLHLFFSNYHIPPYTCNSFHLRLALSNSRGRMLQGPIEGANRCHLMPHNMHNIAAGCVRRLPTWPSWNESPQSDQAGAPSAYCSWWRALLALSAQRF